METSSVAGRNLRLSPEKYSERLWDWTKLNDAFDRGIRVGDIDGLVEVGGQFLLLEGKPPGGRLPKGQRWALERLSELDAFTVVVIEGFPPEDIRAWEILGQEFRREGTYDEFVGFVSLWFQRSDK